MADDTFASFATKLTKFTNAFSDPELKAVMNKVGVNAKKIATAEASADLGGDPKFSGWTPTLDVRFDHIGEGRISFHPSRSGAGPWTVAERGRNQGNAGGFSGPGISRSTGLTSRTKSGGLRKVRATTGKRWNGVTRGKHTATAALARIDRETPPIIEAAVAKTVRKLFD